MKPKTSNMKGYELWLMLVVVLLLVAAWVLEALGVLPPGTVAGLLRVLQHGALRGVQAVATFVS